MQLTLSMDAEHECNKLEAFLSTQLYDWCTSEEDADSTSKDWLLLEVHVSEMFEKSQTTSPDSCALLPTPPSLCTPLNIYIYRNQLHPTRKCSVVVLGYAKVWCYYYMAYACNLATLIDHASLVYKRFISQGSNQSNCQIPLSWYLNIYIYTYIILKQVFQISPVQDNQN